MSTHIPTPMPVGSPHVQYPPMFDTELFHGGSSRRLDRRDYSRRQLNFDIWLIDAAAASVVRCKTNDISDAGLHAIAPIGYGLGVRQRYEVRIAHIDAQTAASPRLAPSLGYATITRIDMKVGRGEGDRIGFALKFDTPQLLPV